MFFGEKIKQLRVEQKWTQEFVAEKLNISVGALSRYETGMYEPKSLELIKDFANLFNVSTDYLLGITDVRNPGKQIDDILTENMIGMTKEEFEKLDKATQQQIHDFAVYIKNQKEKK